MLRMSVYTCICVPKIKRIPEQRGTLGFFEIELWASEEHTSVLSLGRFRVRKDKDVFRLYALFLYARGCNVNVVTLDNRVKVWQVVTCKNLLCDSLVSNSDTSSCSCHPSELVEKSAQLRDKVCWLPGNLLNFMSFLSTHSIGLRTCVGESDFMRASVSAMVVDGQVTQFFGHRHLLPQARHDRR